METLKEFNAFNRDQFASWLQIHLAQKYGPDRLLQYKAFDLRPLGIRDGESHLDDLGNLFDKLEPKAQQSFRQALTHVIGSVNVTAFPYEGMRDLIFMIWRTNARDTLEILWEVIGKGAWGTMHPSLRYDCASTLLGMNLNKESLKFEALLGQPE